MAYYEKHVFFCTNARSNGKRGCEASHASALRLYAKQKLKELNLVGPEKIRVNSAGCMGRCSEGPVMVIYPEAIWYNYATVDDIDEIIQSHLINEEVVDRLKLSNTLNKDAD